jgi:hypothetical protein
MINTRLVFSTKTRLIFFTSAIVFDMIAIYIFYLWDNRATYEVVDISENILAKLFFGFFLLSVLYIPTKTSLTEGFQQPDQITNLSALETSLRNHSLRRRLITWALSVCIVLAFVLAKIFPELYFI